VAAAAPAFQQAPAAQAPSAQSAPAQSVPAASATTAAPVVVKKVVTVHEKDCIVPEVLNAVLCGIIVPAAAWVCIYFAGMQYKKQEGQKLQGDADHKMPILILIGVLVSAILSFVLATVLAIIFKPMCESQNHELTLIKLAAGVAAMVSCLLGLLYNSMGGEQGLGKAARQYMMATKDENGMWQPISTVPETEAWTAASQMSSKFGTRH
jgi:hypothetical protein